MGEQRAFVALTVTTPTVTFVAFPADLDTDAGTLQLRDRNGQPVAALSEVVWEPDGWKTWTATGRTASGMLQTWRAVQVCACKAPSIVETDPRLVPAQPVG